MKSAVADGPDSGGAGPQEMRRALPAVIGALVCVHAAMAATKVTASLLILHQGRAAWMVGALLALFAVAPVGLALWAGRLADRHGLHRPLNIGAAMGVAGAGLAALSQHPVALALAALLTGGALAVAAVGIQREAGLMARNAADLKRVFSWVALGPAASNAVAPVVVGLLIDHVSFRAGFVFAAVLPLAAWLLVRRVPRRMAGQPAATPQRRAGGAWSLWRLGPLRSLIFVNLALSACWDAHTFAVPVLGHARGLSASAIGLVLGCFATAATLVRLLISRWADALQERHVLRAAMFTAIVVCLSYVWLPGAAGMAVGSAVLGLALGSVQPMIMALLHQVTPPDQHGQALGLRMMAANALSMTMPLGFGLLAAATAPAAPLWLMAALIGLALWPAGRIGTTAPLP